MADFFAHTDLTQEKNKCIIKMVYFVFNNKIFGGVKMKIMSFNTQHCSNFYTGDFDYQLMADTINKCKADIVGLNEMRGKGNAENNVSQAEVLADLTGLKHFYFAKAIDVNDEYPYGNALISKYPIISAETIMIPDPVKKTGTGWYETRCLLKVKLENGITVLVTHFGLNLDEQKNAVKTILENSEDEKCILMGDFNVTPDNEVLKPIYRKMKDAGEVIKGSMFTFPSDNPVEKIDYIFVSKDIELVDAQIPEVVASDHRPHTATINI